MYRILVVDDESIIVNGISNMIEKAWRDRLSVYKACDVDEAIAWLEKVKIDIVLTDIRMPGMSGLALQSIILERWPRCKVIFMSGYSDFEYIKQAMRNGSLDYILKTEGEEKIIEAVGKAITALDTEINLAEMAAKSREQLKKAMPSLRREFLRSLIQGHTLPTPQLAERFKELEIPLRANDRVLLVLGRLDPTLRNSETTHITLCMYTAKNIAEKYFDDLCVSQFLTYDQLGLVWLIQPKCRSEGCDKSISWRHALSFVHGVIEQIQLQCEKSMRMGLSFMASSKAVEWKDLYEKFSYLNVRFTGGLTLGGPLILYEDSADDEKADSAAAGFQTTRKYLYRIEKLGMLLESGRREEFFREYSEIHRDVFLSHEYPECFKTEIYLSILALIYHCANEGGYTENWDGLPSINRSISWDETGKTITNIADALFSHQNANWKEQEYAVVNKVKAFVENHIAEDLSLQRISDMVYLSPSYLSRLYKKATGVGLSDYIIDTRINLVKELLAGTDMKAKDISMAAGFGADTSYFFRLFKKKVGITPDQYRKMNKKL